MTYTNSSDSVSNVAAFYAATALIAVLTFGFCSLTFAAAKKGVEKIIFKEQKIEGKIRRPQLVLIKAESRPDFQPMVLESFGKNAEFARTVNAALIEKSPYDGPFQFSGKDIANYAP